ncbi:MAG: hypothetical protein QNJ72_03685 [Pleurocapsa sp. MO_226.B13]|nr:hypothetical protein [Pleurocapsa sp. MO_226.B13]
MKSEAKLRPKRAVAYFTLVGIKFLTSSSLIATNGLTWQEKRSGFPNFEWGKYVSPVQQILLDPSNPNRLLAFTGNQRISDAGGRDRGKVYESVDGGENWQEIANIGNSDRQKEENNIFDVSFAGTSSTRLSAATESGLFRSDNSDFYSLVPGSEGNPRAITRMDFVDGDTFYSVNSKSDRESERGIWRYDAGNWTQLTSDRADGSTPFCWVSDVPVDPRNPERVMAATDQNPFLSVSEATGVWKSEDGGKTWSNFSDGLAVRRVDNIQLKPDSSGTVAIGTTGGGSYIGRLP